MKIFENYINEMAVNPIADKIRQDLKAKGYRIPAQISVTSERGGYERAFRVTIKDLKINDEEIKKIVKKYQSVSYDERSGEILAGGNTYIFVEYDFDTRRREEQRLRPLVAKFVDQALTDKGRDVVKLKNGYSFGVFPHVKDNDINKLKTGQYDVYRNNDMFFVYKNGRKLKPDEEPPTLWWLLVMAGY